MEKGCGFTNWLSTQCWAFSRDLLDEKPSYFRELEGGGGLQMTGASRVHLNSFIQKINGPMIQYTLMDINGSHILTTSQDALNIKN